VCKIQEVANNLALLHRKRGVDDGGACAPLNVLSKSQVRLNVFNCEM
jgi:hypothetical protein